MNKKKTVGWHFGFVLLWFKNEFELLEMIKACQRLSRTPLSMIEKAYFLFATEWL